jgi:hypothetical protein
MKQKFKTLSVSDLDRTWKSVQYDLFLAALGYEERARYVAGLVGTVSKSRIAIGFSEQREHAYEANFKWFEDNEFEIAIIDDDGFREKVGDSFRKAALQREAETLRVLIDISSLSRFRLATIVDLLLTEIINISVSVTFVYSLATYNPPSITRVSNSHVGPVLRSNFAGWWVEPDRGITAIVGLGYEPDKALGAVEHLQAADIWTFTPKSSIARYSKALGTANGSLLASVPISHQVTYSVQSPFNLFVTLESLVYGVMQQQNPVLLPFGPKLFALCCLLVASVHTSVAVWRVSAQALEPAINRKASGHVYGLLVSFGPVEVTALAE